MDASHILSVLSSADTVGGLISLPVLLAILWRVLAAEKRISVVESAVTNHIPTEVKIVRDALFARPCLIRETELASKGQKETGGNHGNAA